MRVPLVYAFAGGAVAAALAFVALRGVSAVAQDVGETVGGAAIDLVDGVVGGAVLGIGIPRTDKTRCERATAEGRTWDASFDCPAGDFIRYLWN